MSKNAVALRRFTLGDSGYLLGAVIMGMADNQFDDLVACELVREATDAEVEAALPPAEDPAPKPSKPRQPRKPATKTQPAPAEAEPAAAQAEPPAE
ncbi:hypothetical protein O4H52_01095 [Sphingomonadaceae bacterium G21617-S1]|nr:hypothetical protein [Sphingomonadaceae bacterium G21617-S1]